MRALCEASSAARVEGQTLRDVVLVYLEANFPMIERRFVAAPFGLDS